MGDSADFLDELIKRLPEQVAHFDHRVVSYEPHGEGVTLRFDGDKNEDVEADVVIASDGIKSTIRRHMFERKGLPLEKQQARYSGWVAWRGIIPR